MKKRIYIEESLMTSRFWSKVNKTEGCWIWTAGHDKNGYGKFSIGSSHNQDGARRNSMVSAHRVSYEIEHGPIPENNSFHGMCVLHRCDNPACVRPDHLFLGTNSENVQDMDAKGRRVVVAKNGSAHGMAILTEEKVREIVRKHSMGDVTQVQLSKEYGVSTSTINHIFTGRLWGHLGLSRKGKKQ